MSEDWIIEFKEKLENYYAWPTLYIFKFIVPKDKAADVKKLFPLHDVSERPSKNGNYTSLTVQMMMPSSESIIEVYKQAAGIEGLIAL
jgi:putative lipoic acid-binding regulatory protein